MGGPGIRKGLLDWLVVEVEVVLCEGEVSEDEVVVESQVSERLQIPERSLLQSGSKMMSPSVG